MKDEQSNFYYTLWLRAAELANKAVIHGNDSDARHFAHSAVSNWRKYEQAHLASQRREGYARFEYRRAA